MTYLYSFVIAAIIFAVLDFSWLSFASSKLYRPNIGEVMANDFRKAPATVFYLIYLCGLLWFAIRPAINSGNWTDALLNGCILGFVAYATYDLTNHAVLKVWSTKVTVIDIVWGTFVTGATAAVTALVVLKVLSK